MPPPAEWEYSGGCLGGLILFFGEIEKTFSKSLPPAEVVTVFRALQDGIYTPIIFFDGSATKALAVNPA